MAKRKNTTEEPIVEVTGANAGGSSSDFFAKNQNTIFGVIGVILLVIAGYFLYKNLVAEPKNKEAADISFQAQMQFERDSFNLALNNPGGGYPGFLEIIDEYSGTKAGNLARYYAGVSYLNMGQYESAVEYLSDFDPAGTILPIMKYGTLADAHAELNEMDKAKTYYEKAVKEEANSFLTPYYLNKLAIVYELEGNSEKALEAYKRIKYEFPSSVEAMDVDKYLVESN